MNTDDLRALADEQDAMVNALCAELQRQGHPEAWRLAVLLQNPTLITSEERAAAARERITFLKYCVGPEAIEPNRTFRNTPCTLIHFNPEDQIPYGTDADWDISQTALLAHKLQVHQLPQMPPRELSEHLDAFLQSDDPPWVFLFWHGDGGLDFPPGYYWLRKETDLTEDAWGKVLNADTGSQSPWWHCLFLGDGQSADSIEQIEDVLTDLATRVLVTPIQS